MSSIVLQNGYVLSLVHNTAETSFIARQLQFLASLALLPLTFSHFASLAFSLPLSDTWSSKSFSAELTSASQPQITITDLRPLTNYNFRVFAVSALGKSEPAEIVVTTDDEGRRERARHCGAYYRHCRREVNDRPIDFYCHIISFAN